MRSLRFFSLAAILSVFDAACGGDTGDTPDGAGGATSDAAQRDTAPRDREAAIDADDDGATADTAERDAMTSDIGRADGGFVDLGKDATWSDVPFVDARDAEAGSPVTDAASSDTGLDAPASPDVHSPDAGPDIGVGTDAGSPPPCPGTFPDETSGVMMQAFYWEPPLGATSWWKMLEGKACDLRKSGITAIWFPPPT